MGYLAAQECDRASLFKQDLTALHDCLKNNHPAFYNTEDIYFLYWLEHGYQAALHFVDTIKNDADHVYGLSFYVQGFCDPHVYINTSYTYDIQWSGWTVAYRHGRYEVIYSEVADVRIGDQLILCDEVPVQDWFNQNIAPFKGSRYQAWTLHHYAYMLTTWEGCSYILQPSSYQLLRSDTEVITVTPQWRSVDIQCIKQFYMPRQQDFALKRFGDGIWVYIPTCAPNNYQEESYKQLINELQTYRSCSYMLFDLRGNGGGNTWYGDCILQTLFGKEYFYACQNNIMLNKKTTVFWRVNDHTLSYIQSLASTLRAQYGQEHCVFLWINTVFAGMKQALENNQPLYQEYDQVESSVEVGESFFTGTIFVVIDSWCVSAALDFIDSLYMVHNAVILVGQPTKADSHYTECCDYALPSNKVTLTFPIKMYCNPVRPAYQAYLPQYYCADIYNDCVLEQLLATIINKI